MLYLLLIVFPITMATSCFVLRKQTELVIVTAVAVVLVQMWLVLHLPLEQPSRLLGVTLSLNELTRLFMLVFLGVGIVSFLATWHLPHGENFVAVALLVLGLVCTILLLQDPFIISLMLVGAGIAAVLAIVDLPVNAGMLVSKQIISAALKYLMLTVLAGVLMYLSFVLADIYKPGILPGRTLLARFILALLTAGFALRLALIPFHTWLPDLVENAAPMVSALVIAVTNTTSLIVLILSFQQLPDLLVDNPTGIILLRIGGIITTLLASIMAIHQPGIRRTLAYLFIYNSGLIFYGLASVSVAGLTGATLEALNQTLAVVLIFICLGLLEQPDGRPPNVVRRDLLRRWPVAGLGFLGGGLSLVGLPPFGGFSSKMLLYESAVQRGGWAELVPLLFSTALAGVALARIATGWLLGPSEDVPTPEPMLIGETELDRPPERRLKPEPRGTAVLVVVLFVLCLAMGIYPQPFLALMSVVIRGLTFVRL